MFSKWSQSRWFKVLGILCLLLVFGLAVASSANATPSPVINTDDGVVDSGWGAPFYTSTCTNDGIPNQNEIKSAWVQSWQTNGGDTGEIYFRLQTCAGPSFTTDQGAIAALDCDRNQTTNTIYDRLIVFNAATDYISILLGNNTFFLSQCDTSVCPYGERVTGTQTSDTSEWRVDYTSLPNAVGQAFPPSCRDDINVAFAVANLKTGVVSDQTQLIGWNVPTAVEVKQIKAYNQPWFDKLGLGALVLFVCLGLGAVIVYRRKQA